MRNVTITARNSSNKLTGQIHIGNDEVVMRSKRMRILDESGKSLLYADKDKFLVNVRGLEFDGKYMCFHFILLACAKFICFVYLICLQY